MTTETADERACVVDVPYLMALNAGVVRAPDGSYWTEPSWAKDLARHFDYLPQLTVLGVIEDRVPGEGYVQLPEAGVRYIAFVRKYGRRNFWRSVPRLIGILWREVRRARIVHTSIAGGPIPIGWFAVPIARLMGRKIAISVESSFWRVPRGATVGVGRRAYAALFETLNAWCVRQADYVSYQHEEYRRSLPSPRAGGGVLTQASWITEEMVLPLAEAEARWAHRTADTARTGRFLFATRLLRDKGTEVLAQAIILLAERGHDLAIDIMGTGAELPRLKTLDGMKLGRGQVRVLEPVPYGPIFFGMLQDYDALLAPGISDEQPRIVYDGGSQAVGSIVSDMPGLRACVEDGRTGAVLPAGDAKALADAIVAAAVDPALCRAWGLAARERALATTHDHMHDERCHHLRALIA